MRRKVRKEYKRWMSVWLVVAMLFTMIGTYSTDTTVYADTIATGKVTGNGVYVRSGAGTGYSKVTQVNYGQAVSILGQQTASDNYIWYNVSLTQNNQTLTGWIRSDFVKLDSTDTAGGLTEEETAYVAALREAGFPESYCTPLLLLHRKYPSWQFVAVKTGLDWDTVIANQSVPGKNLVQSSVNDARKSTDSKAYDWKTNTWYGYDGAGWVCASPEFIAYCMDPRNYLDETYIFQFETLEYEEYQTAAGVSNILANTFMAGDYKDTDGVTRNYANTFAEIGIGLGVSPYHLASRCKQEQGVNGTSPLISGTYAGFEGYYNHFNINAYTTSSASATVNGLTYAKTAKWNSIYKAISGGSAIVADRYVKKGQNTIYFEKFNVVNASNLYSHQYMTNVMAAISEGSSIAKAYTDKNAAFVFRIPVYENMPEKAVEFYDTGNPNNWLSSLSVSTGTLTPSFQADKTEYSVIVDQSVDKITVNAASVSDKATIAGTGTFSLNYGNNVINVNCISQSGVTRTYTITVVRQQPAGTNTPATGGNIQIANGASISTNYAVGDVFTGVQPGTSTVTMISNITATGCNVKILNADGSENTGNVGTGNKVAVYVNGALVKEYPVVIYGDINGDGKISNIDIVMIQKQILGMTKLSGAYGTAADVGKDGKVSNLDIVMIQKHMLNLSQITQ